MITIILPCYNEADRLSPTLREIENFHELHPTIIQKVLIVDDGSRDATVEKALYFKKRLPLEIHILAENHGKWAAVNEGLMKCTGVVLLLDADGAASIWELEAEDGSGSITYPTRRVAVFGSRFLPKSSVKGKSPLRSVVSYGYRAYVMFWYYVATRKRNIDDMQCPFKMFWVEDLQLPLLSERFSGDIEMACKLNATVLNIPIQFEHVRGSKVPITAVWRMFLETPKIALTHRFLREKYVGGTGK